MKKLMMAVVAACAAAAGFSDGQDGRHRITATAGAGLSVTCSPTSFDDGETVMVRFTVRETAVDLEGLAAGTTYRAIATARNVRGATSTACSVSTAARSTSAASSPRAIPASC